MIRITEPEVMLDYDQCKAFSDAPREILRSLFLKSFQNHVTTTGNVIDIGCGPADYIIALSEIVKDVSIIGLDRSPAMLDIAKHHVERKGLSETISIVNEIDQKFDIVISNNTLHHFHDANDFWNLVKDYSKKGTEILVSDLLRPESIDAVHAIIDRYAKDTSKIYQLDFLNSLKAAFTVEEIQKQLLDNNLELTIKVLGSEPEIIILHGFIK